MPLLYYVAICVCVHLSVKILISVYLIYVHQYISTSLSMIFNSHIKTLTTQLKTLKACWLLISNFMNNWNAKLKHCRSMDGGVMVYIHSY